ncbi:xylulokinase [Sediminibacterium soli]|uniref:xylulokinase n=1 Tax=Sediminibacterium soli TaxID=2698829 RepID=UPI00137B11CE|nr:FGGY family carbohydrate kinase [Sediminibacterium soli]NCI45733.1 carbohydrate kinase [Sediminibacterium soli]
MLLLGIDVGTSSIKVSVVDAGTQQCIVSAQYPETETGIVSHRPGWAEQSPAMWWLHVQEAIHKAHASKKYNSKDIGAIGIAYQMHGLVLVDRQQQVLRDSIIWCDSRAVNIGNQAFRSVGEENCLASLLNSPGNFTASKLAWVKENEPEIYAQADKFLLPGDFISMKLTGETTTTPSALSEGIFWDFPKDTLSADVFSYFGFDRSFVPRIQKVFSEHGQLKEDIAGNLLLKPGIPVSYKAGDQLNNALSLNVLQPGEVAATAGTSGVIYSVSDTLAYDRQSRVNTFAHVNHTGGQKRLGVLLCINGTGIMNNWVRRMTGGQLGYAQMNEAAAQAPEGSEGLFVLPFGNGAERMLNNETVGAHFHNIDLNKHTASHLYRSVQEGIACSFRYGLDIMRENGLQPSVIRAGKANLFLSDVFVQAFVNALNVPVELYACDGSVGAAIGAGLGAGVYANEKEAFANMKCLQWVAPSNAAAYNGLYEGWKSLLEQQLKKQA